MASLTKVKLNNIDTSVTFVYDPLVLLNYGSTVANTDIGFVFNRDGGISSNVALYWNESTDRITIAYTGATGLPNSNIAVTKLANVAADWYFGNLAGGTTNTVWVSANVLPTANAFYNFGSPTQRWNVGYFAATTLDLGGSQISVDPVNGFKFTVGGTGTPTFLASNGLVAGTTISTSGTLSVGTSASVGTNLTAGGYINAAGNILAAAGTLNALTVNGNETVTGFLNVVGNILSSGAVHNSLTVNGPTNTTNYINTSANILAAGGIFNGLTVNGNHNSTGFINTTANVSAAIGVFGAINSTGLINTTANISASMFSGGQIYVSGLVNAGGNILASSATFNVLDVNGNVEIGAINTPGVGHSIIGNVVQSGAGIIFYNTPGNIMAAIGRFGTVVSDGLINTSANVMAAVGRFGQVSSDGFINTSANVSAASHVGGSVVVSGVINTAGNVLTKEITVFGNATIGAISTAGVVHTIVGNIRQSGAGTVFFNTPGNIMAAIGRFGSISTDGYINTSANISTAQLNAGQINTSGNVLATSGTFNALTVNGNESVTGFLNVTGNILSTGAILNSLTVNGNESVTGFLNVTGNILGAIGTFSAINSSGYINSVGNISTPQLNAGQINTTGNVLATSGVFNSLTVNGNESITGFLNVTGNILSAAGTFNTLTVNGNETVTGFLNVTGNVVAAQGSFSSINSTGFINTTGNVSASTIRSAQINTTGNVLATVGTFNALTVNGNETVTGFLNVTGNVLGAGAIVNSLIVNGGITSTGFFNTTANIAAVNISAGLLAVDSLTLNNSEISSTSDITLNPGGAIGNINVSGARITNLTSPLATSDAATKAYVDEVAEGLKAKPAVELATTGNLIATYNNGNLGIGGTLTSTTNGAFPTIDGVTLTSITPGENGVLVKNQTARAQNGRYNLTQVGDGSTPWILTRCGLCDEADEIPGAYVFVKAGDLYAGTGWVQTVNDPATFVVGVDDIFVTQFSGVGTYTAGTNLVLNGTEFSLANSITLSGSIAATGNLSAAHTQLSSITSIGAITSTGFINTSANISASQGRFGSITSTGFINTSGNISAAQIAAGSIDTSGNITAPFFLGTLATASQPFITSLGVLTSLNTSGNVLAQGGTFNVLNVNGNETVTGFLNVSGNVLAATGVFGSVNSTGFINTSGNVSAATGQFGAINSTGFINTTGNISADTVRAGQINTTGNVLALNVLSNFITADDAVVGNISAAVFGNVGASFTGGTLNITGNTLLGLTQAAAINSTPIGNATASTGAFTTLSATSTFYANSTTPSTTQTTGAIVAAGGIGATGNITAGTLATPGAQHTLFGNVQINAIGSIQVPVGTTLQRPDSTTAGQIRFNTDTNLFEGYSNVWGAISGGGGGGGGTPGGVTSTIQYNNGGALGGIGVMNYILANDAIIMSSGISSTSTATGALQIIGGVGITENINTGGSITTTGLINTSANVLASQVSAGSVITTGLVNAGGNVLASAGIFNALNVNGNIAIGDVTVPGAGHTIVGNVTQSSPGTTFFNIVGNLMAQQGSFGSIDSTGFINTLGNVAALEGDFGTVIATAGVFPLTDNTGALGNAALTWSNGQFTNLTIDSTLNVRAAIDLADSDVLRLGSGVDWEFFHDGTGNYMDLNVGDLIIRDNTTTKITIARTTGTINTVGNLLADAGTFNALTVNGTITNSALWQQGADIGGSVDLNTYTTSGWYHQNTNANASSGTNYPTALAGLLEVFADGLMVYQRYTLYNSGQIYTRSYYNGTWYAWRLELDSTNYSSYAVPLSGGTMTGTLTGRDIVPSASNTYSVGSTTAWYSAFWGKAVNAAYADLAETYSSDRDYIPGTVLIFGGEREVTISTQSHDPAIAGVVSTNPGYHMNAGAEGVAVALQGRVPTKVKGPVRKGDRVVSSSIQGAAERLDMSKYQPGCIIGKALEDILDDSIQYIEVVVGRV